MAGEVTAAFQNIGEVRRDLDSVSLGLGRELAALLRSDVATVARKTSSLTVRGPGPRSLHDNLPHVAETITGVSIPTGVAVVSSHPGAGVLEYGGTISPRGVPIKIDEHGMAHAAGEAELPGLERRLTQRIDALLAAHGLT
jgi:hypothetical protein